MIILYEKNEKLFTSLGLGVLRDAISCIVLEELNGTFELELEYPINGQHYSDIDYKRIVFTKPNEYDTPQPFRIYSIVKSIEGTIIVNAEHISYDMSGYTIKAFDAISLFDALIKIQNGSVIESPFTFSTNKINVNTTMKTQRPYNMRALLAGQEGSLLDIYGGEYKFDKFNVELKVRRGEDRGVTIRHGKNMTDLEKETKTDKVYTGVFPFYFNVRSDTKTVSETYYTEIFIAGATVDPVWSPTPLMEDWLSMKEDGKPLTLIIEDYPVQIKTEGAYFNQIYIYSKRKTDAYIHTGVTEFGSTWLLNAPDGGTIIPVLNTRYLVKTEGDFAGKTYRWNGTAYILFTGEGMYEISSMEPFLVRSATQSSETVEYIDLTTAVTTYIVLPPDSTEEFSTHWLGLLPAGVELTPNEYTIYIVKTEGNYYDIKYTWDEALQSYVPFLGNGVIYINESADPQRILTLDLTQSFSELPTAAMLEEIANAYILDNKIGDIDSSITVSFIKLADSSEYELYSDLEKVELGDTVKIIYEELGIEDVLEVISVEFNSITEKYNEIELGKKVSRLGDTALTSGDNVSSLTNDKNYAEYTTVINLIAKMVTAEFIQASNAQFSEAQIRSLEVSNIKCSGIIEASMFDIDKVVSKMLVADGAEIKNVLKAGNIEVNGKINVTGKGSISITDENDNENFNVNSKGEMTAEKAFIRGSADVDKVNTKELIFDNRLKVELIEGSVEIEEQTVIFTGHCEFLYNESQDTSTLYFSASSNLALWFNKDVRVTVKYKTYEFDQDWLPVNVFDRNSSATVTIAAGQTVSPDVEVNVIGHVRETYNVSRIPSSITETRSSGSSQGIGFGSHVYPIDSINNDYDLGASDKEWNCIYLKTPPIVSSDIRKKKEINYDISIYEKLFEKLKPVSYKFIEGTSDRIHLGFISQDVGDSLIELGMNPKDFAGFIKGLKPESKNKEVTTEDDYSYGLRYEEFIAIAIKEIQNLNKRVKMLEELK